MAFSNVLRRYQNVVKHIYIGPALNPISRRLIFCSAIHRHKEIRKIENDASITVEGVYVESPRVKHLIKFENHPTDELCSLCRFNIPIRHTDVLILNQFVNSYGKVIPRKVTGLCRDQHKRVEYLVVMAQKAGLMPMYKGKVLQELSGWEAYNKYYNEAVIDEFFKGRRNRA